MSLSKFDTDAKSFIRREASRLDISIYHLEQALEIADDEANETYIFMTKRWRYEESEELKQYCFKVFYLEACVQYFKILEKEYKLCED